MQRHRRQVAFFTVGLFLVALLVGVAVWISPIQVGRFLGSMVIAYSALQRSLALVNFVEFAIERGTTTPWFQRWFGEGTQPLVAGAYVVTFVIVFGAINAYLHPFHRVRLCDGGDCIAPPSDGWPDRKKADRRRRGERLVRAGEDRPHKRGWDGPVPMLIVATAGGGIRAAYWTATVLEQLEKDFEARGAYGPISSPSAGSPAAASAPPLSRRRWRNATRTGKRAGRRQLSARDDISDRGFPRAGSREPDLR